MNILSHKINHRKLRFIENRGGGSTLKKAIPPKIPFFSLTVKNCLFLLKKYVNEIVLLFNT